MRAPLMPKQTTAAKATKSSMRRVMRREFENNEARAKRIPRTFSQRGEWMLGRS